MLGDVLGAATKSTGEVVGVFNTQAFDQHLQGMGQLVNVDTVEVAQFHGDFLVGVDWTPSCLNIRAVSNRQQAQQEGWASGIWSVGNVGHVNRKAILDRLKALGSSFQVQD
ncbi:hypothetical protein D3C72_2140520 [compost metagenome]